MPYPDKEFFASREMMMTGEEVVLSRHPSIMGDVVYRVGFKPTGSPRDFEVEITDVAVEDIKSPVYDENGDPVILGEDDKLKFENTAYKYFWNHLANKAEDKAVDQIQMGG